MVPRRFTALNLRPLQLADFEASRTWDSKTLCHYRFDVAIPLGVLLQFPKVDRLLHT